MTRSIEPILRSPAPKTAVPSTLSLPIRLPNSLSVVICQILHEGRSKGATCCKSDRSRDQPPHRPRTRLRNSRECPAFALCAVKDESCPVVLVKERRSCWKTRFRLL